MYIPKFFKRLVSSLIIGGQAINFILRGKISKNDLSDQLMESGPGSLLIVLITGVAAGTVFNIQVASQLTSMGVSSEIGGLLAVGMAREMAPLLTATLMTGKVATAYAAQLGTMKVTEQIEAITMLRTEPIQYLVVPRLLSMIIMSPIQCLLFLSVALWSGQIWSTIFYNVPPIVFWTSVRSGNVSLTTSDLSSMIIMSPIQCLLFLSVALWSGQIWSTIFYNVPPIVFWTSVRSGNVSLTNSDLSSMMIKSVVFGLLISIIACGYGLTTKGGPKEVGTSTTGAVVMTLVTVSLMDVVLTQILFG